ncbi:VOC family protein [Bdellovibrio bacteriovorus]
METVTTKFEFEDFRSRGEQFFQSLIDALAALGLPTHLASDHLCFRVATTEEYQEYKTHLLNHGTLLTEAHVNGRPIATFKLHTPFKTKTHEIPLVELPAPKPGANYASGFEHAEFIIEESFETFAAKFPKVKFEEPTKKTINAEMCLKLEGKQAKFHHQSLERIIEMEKGES